MPDPIVHDSHRSIAARIVGSMSDEVLAGLLRGDIAHEIAAAELRGPDAIAGEDALVRELLPVLRELPHAGPVNPPLHDVRHPAALLAWLRNYGTVVGAHMEGARADSEELGRMKDDVAGMRRILGGAYTG